MLTAKQSAAQVEARQQLSIPEESLYAVDSASYAHADSNVDCISTRAPEWMFQAERGPGRSQARCPTQKQSTPASVDSASYTTQIQILIFYERTWRMLQCQRPRSKPACSSAPEAEHASQRRQRLVWPMKIQILMLYL
jgi:hypothetical protein